MNGSNVKGFFLVFLIIRDVAKRKKWADGGPGLSQHT